MDFTRVADIKRTEFIVDEIKRACEPWGTVLDIGCGNGIITRAVGAAGFNVTGIDVSDESIMNARGSNNFPNVTFKVVAAEELKVEPGKYDAIICSEVLEHLNKPEDLLKIIYGSLKDDGVLIVTVPNGRGPRELFVTRPIQALQKNNGLAWRLVSRIKSLMGYKGITVQSAASDLTHIQFFTEQSLRRLATNTGFYIEKIMPSNFIEQMFPFSLMFKRSRRMQKLDYKLAAKLPLSFTSGFLSIWQKANPLQRRGVVDNSNLP